MGPSSLARLLTYLVRVAGPHSRRKCTFGAGQGERQGHELGRRHCCQSSLCHALACQCLSFPSQPRAHTHS